MLRSMVLVLQHVSDEVTKSTKIDPDMEVSAQDLTDRQQIQQASKNNPPLLAIIYR